MGDTIELWTKMEEMDIKRDAARVSNDLMRSLNNTKKARAFIDFYKEVCPQGDIQKLLGVSEAMSLDDFIASYKKLCDMQ